MNKEFLIEYNDLIRERNKLEKRIHKLEKQSEMVSDVVQNGFKRHAIIYGYDLIRKRKLHELHQTLKIREAMIIVQQVKIENFINDINKSELRQIFEHRYIDSMEWKEIADIMHYADESVPRKRHDRFLERKEK